MATPRTRIIFRLLRAIAVFLSIANSTLANAQDNAQNSALEYAVKATYLYKFGPFVRWPETAFAAPDSPFTICVAGPAAVGEQLDRIARGAQPDGQTGARATVVRHLQTATAYAGCHILYITGAPATVAEVLKQTKGSPILTVTELNRDGGNESRSSALNGSALNSSANNLIGNSSNNSANTGIINFVILGNRVRFEVDTQSAADNELALSSKLLSLASSVTHPSAERSP